MYPKYFFETKDQKPLDGAANFFFFFDFDGTLVPIQDDPSGCVLSPEIKDYLNVIISSGKAYVAILSGRTMRDIKKLAPIEGIYYGGNHGLEISGPNITFVHPDALCGKRATDRIFKKIKKRILNIEGAVIEKKKYGFSLHYRRANKEDKATIKRIFYETIDNSIDRQTFSVLRGKKVLELVPRVKWDKGKAALFLLESQNKNYLPLYVGDDKTDEKAFQALGETGITVRIGKSKKSVAQYYLKGQWQISRFLKHVNNLIQEND